MMEKESRDSSDSEKVARGHEIRLEHKETKVTKFERQAESDTKMNFHRGESGALVWIALTCILRFLRSLLFQNAPISSPEIVL